MTLNLPEKEICDKYLSGMSMIRLGEIYKCYPSTIRSRLKKNNIKLRSISEAVTQKYNNSNLREKRSLSLPDQEICEKYLFGVSIKNLSKEYKCDYDTIVRRLNKNNTKFRSQSEINVLISKSLKQAYIDYPTIAEKQSLVMTQLYINNPTLKERISARHQGQDYDAGEWTGFIDIPGHSFKDCIFINDPFPGCHRHHMSEELVICIPGDLHTHIWHNLDKGVNMYEINMISIQYLLGY